MPDAIDRVGLGVDLQGGSDTLTQLRAIREEMALVSRLAGRTGSSGTTSTTDIETRQIASIKRVEREQIASAQRIARARTPITDAEINSEVIVAQRRIKLREATQAKLKTITEQELALERAIQQRRELIIAQGEARLERFNQQQATRSTRSSSARFAAQDERDEASAPLRAKLAQGRKDNINNIINERAAEQERRRLVRERLTAMDRENTEQFNLIKRSIRDEQIGIQERRALAAQQQRQPITDLENAIGRSQSDVYGTLYSRKVPIKKVSEDEANRKKEQEELRAYIQGGGDPKKFKSSVGGPGGPGGEDEEDEGGSSGGKKGQLGIVSRITRNYLLYRGLTLLTSGTYEYTKAAIENAKAVTEQANALKFASEAAGGNLERNRALANQLEKVGLNDATSRAVVAQAARATYRNPAQTGQLAQLATDIAASRGGGVQNAGKIIEDIQEGRDRTYREYFNITPEDLYKQEAKKVIGQRTDASSVRVGNDPRDYLTEKQEISKYVASLSEADKEQIRLTYAISQMGRFSGDAAARAQTFAGKLDLLSAFFFNASSNLGQFIGAVRPVKDFLDYLIQLGGPGGTLATPELRQSGPRNTITDTDVTNFAYGNVTGKRATALDTVSRITGLIANNITPINTVKNYVTNPLEDFLKRVRVSTSTGGVRNPYGLPGLTVEKSDAISDRDYERILADNQARVQQQKVLNDLRAQGQLGYRALRSGDGAPGQYSTYEELTKRGLSAGDIRRNYIEDVRPKIDTFDNTQADAALDEYRTQALKREDERKQKERGEKDKVVQERANALSKLRDTSQGSFRLISDIGESLTGRDNQFTKVLADQITAAERMRQQWGFLGQAAVNYFTTLEQAALKRQLNQAEYGAFGKASDLINQSGRETDTRNDPTTLSRREQDYLNIQNAIVNKATQIPQLWKQAAEVLRSPGLSPTVFLATELGNLASAYGVRGPRIQNALGQDITPDGRRYNSAGQDIGGAFDIPERLNAYGQSLEDPNAIGAFRNVGVGKSPQLQRQLRQSFASSILGSFQGLSPAQIRASGLSSYYRAALVTQAQGLGEGVQDQIAKAQLGANEDARLDTQLKADERFRQDQLRKGYDVSDVGRESDKLLLSRTNGVNPKDLTYDQFQARQEALRRDSERQVKDQQEAKEATQQALAYQKELLAEVTKLRASIVGGDASVLIQVQNDTQARVDKQSLEESEPGPLKALNLDQRGVKSSPFTPSTERYHREGGTFGLTNR